MGIFTSYTSAQYEQTITAAELNPKDLTGPQKDMMKALLKETGERGNRARKAMGQ